MHKDVRQAKGIGFGEVGRCSDVRAGLGCSVPRRSKLLEAKPLCSGILRALHVIVAANGVRHIQCAAHFLWTVLLFVSATLGGSSGGVRLCAQNAFDT